MASDEHFNCNYSAANFLLLGFILKSRPMTDENTIKLQNLSFENVANFLTEKKVSSTCSACGHKQVAILTAPDGVVARIYSMYLCNIASEKSWKVDTTNVLASVATECENCGIQQHFTAATILKWLNNRNTPNV